MQDLYRFILEKVIKIKEISKDDKAKCGDVGKWMIS